MIDLVDEIYEAAIIGDLWPKTLTDLSNSFDARGAIVYAVANQEHSWTTSGNLTRMFETYIKDGWIAQNDRATRYMERKLTGFITEYDLYSPEEFEQSSFLNEFCRPNGIGREIGTVINAPNGDMIAFSIQRGYDQQVATPSHIERANQLRPDIARAAVFSARLGLQKAQAQAQALEALGLPGGVVSDQGRLIAVNGLANSMIPTTMQDRTERLAFVDKATDRRFAEALSVLRYERRGISIPLTSKDGPTSIAHFLPIRRSAHDIFSSAATIMVITSLATSQVPSEALLQGLFDLTPAEARVTRAIASAQSIADIAKLSGNSTETIRTQLKTVMSKTGTNRQAELVGLLSGKFLISRD